MDRRNVIKNLGFLGLSIFLAPRLLAASGGIVKTKQAAILSNGCLSYYDGLPIITHEQLTKDLKKLFSETPEAEAIRINNMFRELKYGKTTIISWKEFFESN